MNKYWTKATYSINHKEIGNIFNCTEVSLVPTYEKTGKNIHSIGHISSSSANSNRNYFSDFAKEKELQHYPCYSCNIYPICGGACQKEWKEGWINLGRLDSLDKKYSLSLQKHELIYTNQSIQHCYADIIIKGLKNASPKNRKLFSYISLYEILKNLIKTQSYQDILNRFDPFFLKLTRINI